MGRLVKVKLAKVHILSILDCYYRLFPLIYIGFDSEGITIQGSCEEWRILTTMVIPWNSFGDYECRDPVVVAIPNHLKKLGGRCVRINVLRVDSWRVRNVFKSDNRVSYEALSSAMYKLSTHPQLDSRISFEQNLTAKKCFEGVDIEVSVKDRIATIRGEIFRISTFIIGEPGEPYCMIPDKHLKLLNKFLGATFNNLKIEFCKKDENLLFSVDKEHYHINLQLTNTKVWLIMSVALNKLISFFILSIKNDSATNDRHQWFVHRWTDFSTYGLMLSKFVILEIRKSLPPIRINGDLKVFINKNEKGKSFSLAISVDESNKELFKGLEHSLSGLSSNVLPSTKPEDFKSIKESKKYCNVYCKIYTYPSGTPLNVFTQS